MTRRRLTGNRAALVALAWLVAIVGTACATERPVPIGVQEFPADVVYADGSIEDPPPPPPAADPGTGSPGFLAPPAPTQPPPPPPSPSPTPAPTASPTPEPDGCPADDLIAVPEESPQSIDAPPTPGLYRYRQEGTVTVDGTESPVQAEVDHVVGNVEELSTGNLRYEVAISEGDLVTTTTYDVRRGGIDDGLYLTQIRAEDDSAVGAFTPAFAIQVLPAPALPGTAFSSSGVDPLTGVAMSIHGTIIGKTRVDACGTPLDAWQVEVGADPVTGQPSRITGPDKDLVITGTYAVSTWLGGLVVRDALTFEGTEGGQDVLIQRLATINQTSPDPAPTEPASSDPASSDPASPDLVAEP